MFWIGLPSWEQCYYSEFLQAQRRYLRYFLNYFIYNFFYESEHGYLILRFPAATKKLCSQIRFFSREFIFQSSFKFIAILSRKCRDFPYIPHLPMNIASFIISIPHQVNHLSLPRRNMISCIIIGLFGNQHRLWGLNLNILT